MLTVNSNIMGLMLCVQTIHFPNSLCPVQDSVGLEPLLSVTRREAGYIPDSSAVLHWANTETNNYARKQSLPRSFYLHHSAIILFAALYCYFIRRALICFHGNVNI
ncbi:hypothetical protein ILYODFUR_007163 [Ilyodon furcidens]|uniref:Uncharacterized protein n=1 Tax=Ilyodon furcidens TaxID=33524 RepID=A0ABV0V2R4_9TELE